MDHIENRSPVTGRIISTYAVPSPGEIAGYMNSARQAFEAWKNISVKERTLYLAALRHAIVDNMGTVIETICGVTGKVPGEAIQSDIYPTLNLIRYYEKHAEKTLEEKPTRTPLLYAHTRSSFIYRPLGVALIIAPWNHPLQLALAPAITALCAGNTVILKPSEQTLTVGSLIHDLCCRANLPSGILQVVSGNSETGALLIDERPDIIFFTGSTSSGKKIMARAAGHLIPVILELGGKDPMIVCEDAHFERAVNGALYGAFSNSGQTCVSVERLYVQEQLYEKFISALSKKITALRVGADSDSDIGAVTLSSQRDIIEDHLRDAAEQGATLIPGIRKEGPFIHPVIIRDASHAMKIMNEETFGPVLPVMRFTTEDEAVALANDSPYGLGASVWTADMKKGRRVAARLNAGCVAVNDVIRNVGNPYLPFGGTKQSGFGRYHGPEGLYAFSRQTALMTNTGAAAHEMNWFPCSRELCNGLIALFSVLFGRRTLGRLRALAGAIPLFRKRML